MKKPKRFAIWANTGKETFWQLLPDILAWAKTRNLEVHVTTRILKFWEDKDRHTYKVIESAEDFSKMDFILTLGGDGTILGAARNMGSRNIPLLGVHLGELGFLANITKTDLYMRLDQVAEGDYELETRRVLSATIRKGNDASTFIALNDIVINPIKSHRMITCIVKANGRLLGRYKADGIIVATPTGSTAYSLAAGGPVVVPDVESIIVTPICPHTLTSRPVVVGIKTQVEITFPESTVEVGLSIDGQIHDVLTTDTIVEIHTGEYSIPFIQFKDRDYFQMLRTKMGWGRRGEV